MTISIVRPIRYTTDPDLLGGPNGQQDSFILKSGGGSDKILQSNNRDTILQSGTTDEILLSSNTCTDNILQSGTTDKILLSGGGSDELLIVGNCSSSLLQSGTFIVRTN